MLVLERDVFPRFHIGESQVPWTDEVFRELGIDGLVAWGGFVEKWGASFTSSDGSAEKYADFTSAPETPRPQTYQVTRAEFDQLVLEHAARSGATVLQDATCLDVAFAPDHVAIRHTARGWFWLIPVSETVTSVGVVLPKAVHAARAGASLDDALDRCLRETPATAALLANARRLSEVRFDADYSYESRAYAGDRWLIAGDAAAFLDPIFSTGVLLAMQAGIDAGDALHAALAAGDVSHARFRGYERLVTRRYRWFRRFATGFYDPAFRDVFFASDSPFGIREAVLSVLAGNWRPSLPTRLRLLAFFAAIAVHRRFSIAPRVPNLASDSERPRPATVTGPAD